MSALESATTRQATWHPNGHVLQAPHNCCKQGPPSKAHSGTFMAPNFIPESSRLPSNHDTNAPVPSGWTCYRFFWAGYEETPYYYNHVLGLCTTLDLSRDESTQIPEEVLQRCQTRPYGQEILLYPVYPGEEKRENSFLTCMAIDHVNRQVYTFSNGSLLGDGDEDQYSEYAMYTHNSHLKCSDAGHVCANCIVVLETLTTSCPQCAAVSIVAKIQSG